MRLNSASNATDDIRLVSPWLIVGLFSATLFAFVLLFPAPALKRQIAKTPKVNAVILNYLELMVRASPEALEARRLLAKKALQAKDTGLAKVALSPWLDKSISRENSSVALLRLKLAQQVAYASPIDSQKRLQHVQKWAHMAKTLTRRLNYPELMRTARVARSLGQYRLSEHLALAAVYRVHQGGLRRKAFIYAVASLVAGNRTIMAIRTAQKHMKHIPMTTHTWQYLAKVAMAAGLPRQSAHYELRSFNISVTPEQRLRAYLTVVADLLKAGTPKRAINFAQDYLSHVPKSPRLWRYLTRVALKANRPQLAARFASNMLGYSGSER